MVALYLICAAVLAAVKALEWFLNRERMNDL